MSVCKHACIMHDIVCVHLICMYVCIMIVIFGQIEGLKMDVIFMTCAHSAIFITQHIIIIFIIRP